MKASYTLIDEYEEDVMFENIKTKAIVYITTEFSTATEDYINEKIQLVNSVKSPRDLFVIWQMFDPMRQSGFLQLLSEDERSYLAEHTREQTEDIPDLNYYSKRIELIDGQIKYLESQSGIQNGEHLKRLRAEKQFYEIKLMMMYKEQAKKQNTKRYTEFFGSTDIA